VGGAGDAGGREIIFQNDVRFGAEISRCGVNTHPIMKKFYLLSALIFAAAQGAAAQTITTETPSAIFSEDSDVSVARGMSREAVSFMLGLPSETIGTDVWFFYNFRGRGAAAAENLDTLLVVFADDRVTTLRVCDGRPVRELIAKQKAKRAPKTASAK
jgi:hypothetical protein